MATYLKGISCEECPDCADDPCSQAPAAELVCDTIAATVDKCGYSEYTGYESTPPKRYLKKTLEDYSYPGLTEVGYANTDCTNCQTTVRANYSGYCYFDDEDNCADGEINYSGELKIYRETGTGNCAEVLDDTQLACGIDWAASNIANTTESFTATTRTVTGSGSCVSSSKTTGASREVLSDEYTTAMLISNTEASIPSYPGTWEGECEAVRDLSTDELTYAIQRFKYKFILPDLEGFDCYRIEWMEGSTAKSYQWNGTDTETTPIEVTEPASNGTIEITDIVYSCECS